MVQAGQKPDLTATGIQIAESDTKEVIELRILERADRGRVLAMKILADYLQTSEGEIKANILLTDSTIKQILHQSVSQEELNELSDKIETGKMNKKELEAHIRKICSTLPQVMQSRIEQLKNKETVSEL